jgi:hypothetical protein
MIVCVASLILDILPDKQPQQVRWAWQDLLRMSFEIPQDSTD